MEQADRKLKSTQKSRRRFYRKDLSGEENRLNEYNFELPLIQAYPHSLWCVDMLAERRNSADCKKNSFDRLKLTLRQKTGTDGKFAAALKLCFPLPADLRYVFQIFFLPPKPNASLLPAQMTSALQCCRRPRRRLRAENTIPIMVSSPSCPFV